MKFVNRLNLVMLMLGTITHFTSCADNSDLINEDVCVAKKAYGLTPSSVTFGLFAK